MNPQNDGLVAVVLKVGAAHYIPITVLVVAVIAFWHLDAYFGTFSFFLPILVAGGLWLIAQGNKDKADRQAIESISQSEARKNGEWSAVCGKAIALEPDAAPPFEDVLAFRYEVLDYRMLDKERDSKLTVTHDGFYLAPTGIETGEGVVRLAGFPDLIHLAKRSLPVGVGSRAEEQAQLNPQYLPHFLSRAVIVSHTRDRMEAYIKYYKVNEETARSKRKSWTLLPGEQICVFGIWKDGELLPSVNRPRGLPVYAGSAEEVLARLKDDSSAFFIVGASLIFVAAAWMVVSYLL